ncbi:nucleotidyltransferase family protein [Glaesserella parasuis]|uniref:nucleotidyltransferase family protein n=1 Tax=Glaesserella parasuis TaxID=738 RepID=UPI0038530B88
MIDLTEQQLHLVQRILATHLPNIPVWVFGSRIKGTAKRFSDLDLALITDTPLTIRQQAQLESAFSDSDLPFKVDLIDWASCSENFKQIILQKYEVLPCL